MYLFLVGDVWRKSDLTCARPGGPSVYLPTRYAFMRGHDRWVPMLDLIYIVSIMPWLASHQWILEASSDDDDIHLLHVKDSQGQKYIVAHYLTASFVKGSRFLWEAGNFLEDRTYPHQVHGYSM